MTKHCSWNYHENYKKMGRTWAEHVLPMFCACIFHGNSMNNLLSYCGLIDAKIRASDKDLPVPKISIFPYKYMIGDLINSQNISWYMQVNGKRIRFLIVINVKGQTGHLYEKFMSQVWMVGYINLVHTQWLFFFNIIHKIMWWLYFVDMTGWIWYEPVKIKAYF